MELRGASGNVFDEDEDHHNALHVYGAFAFVTCLDSYRGAGRKAIRLGNEGLRGKSCAVSPKRLELKRGLHASDDVSSAGDISGFWPVLPEGSVHQHGSVVKPDFGKLTRTSLAIFLSGCRPLCAVTPARWMTAHRDQQGKTTNIRNLQVLKRMSEA